MDPTPVPYPMQFCWDNELYFMILLMGVVFTYAPKIVLWLDVSGAIAWMAGGAWVAMQPDVHAAFSIVPESISARCFLSILTSYYLDDPRIRSEIR